MRSRTLAVSRRAITDGLMVQAAIGAVGSSALFGGGKGPAPRPPPLAPRAPGRIAHAAEVRHQCHVPPAHRGTPLLVGTTYRSPPAARATERWASGAADSRSDEGAEAIGGRLHAVVRLGLFHWAGEWDGFCFGRLCPLDFPPSG